MSKVVHRAAVITAAALISFGGTALVAPSLGYADPPGQGCAAAHAKGGPNSCSGDGSAPIEGREAECYRGAAAGAIAGAITGNPAGAGAGAVGGCVSAATSPSAGK